MDAGRMPLCQHLLQLVSLRTRITYTQNRFRFSTENGISFSLAFSFTAENGKCFFGRPLAVTTTSPSHTSWN